MKQKINLSEQDIPEFVNTFITVWKKRKGYENLETVTLGETIELITATTFTYYKEDSDSRFFNNVLRNHESSLLWDGEELIDILFYEAVEDIKKRCAIGGTFNQVIDNSNSKE